MRLRFLRSEELFYPPLGKENRGSVGALLLGIVILSDWIASSNYFAQAELWINPAGWGGARKMSCGKIFDAERTDIAGRRLWK